MLIAPIFTYNVIDESKLPLTGWQFYNITTLKVYWITHLYQSVFLGYSYIIMLAHDVAFYGFMLHLCGQADVIKHRIVSLAKLNKDMQHKQLVLVVKQHISLYRWKCYNYYVLLNTLNCCIVLIWWNLIIKEIQNNNYYSLVYEMQGIFGTAVTMSFILLMGTFSLTLYSLIIGGETGNRAFLVFYIMVLGSIVCFYCYFGNQVMLQVSHIMEKNNEQTRTNWHLTIKYFQSASIRDALIEMDWTSCDNKFAINLLIIFARSQTPAKLIIGNVIDLSLETFLRVSFDWIIDLTQNAQKFFLHVNYFAVLPSYLWNLEHAENGNKWMK